MSVPASSSRSSPAPRGDHKRKISRLSLSPEAKTRQPAQFPPSNLGLPLTVSRVRLIANNADRTPSQVPFALSSDYIVNRRTDVSFADFDPRQHEDDGSTPGRIDDLTQGREDPYNPSFTSRTTDAPLLSTEHAADVLVDPAVEDEGYVASSRTSFATTVASEVDRLVEENGRLYPNYGRHEYGLPVDHQERDRLGLQHQIYLRLLDNRLFLSPLGESPQNILDLATGTGDWAMKVADQFPSAVVTGVDVVRIQSRWLPTNCEFEIRDIEETWLWRVEHFDFIHLRDALFVVRDWATLVSRCYRHLKPGGWCEFAGTFLAPTSDDGRVVENSGFGLMCAKLVEASKLFGTPADYPLHFAGHLQHAGFVNVTERVFPIPSCAWPEDQRQKEIGNLEEVNLQAGASALGLRVLEHAFGWTQVETEVAMVDFRKDSAKQEYRQSLPHFVVYGQKPRDPVDA